VRDRRVGDHRAGGTGMNDLYVMTRACQ
jgi:hypothetical protein